MADGSANLSQVALNSGAFQIQSFSQTVVGLLREMILTGRFGPGERLNELAISEQLKISRSPIREALQTLAGQGLVSLVPGRGAYVAEFDAQSVQQLGEVRIALEVRAAKLAAERITPAQLESMHRILESADAAIRDGMIDQMRSAPSSGSRAPERGASRTGHRRRTPNIWRC
jgi:DNA-binding GntR family transcriptional regulator